MLPAAAGLEFFYSQAPLNMRSFTAALNLLTTALGAWLCIPLVYIANSDPNHQVGSTTATHPHRALTGRGHALAPVVPGLAVLRWLVLTGSRG